MILLLISCHAAKINKMEQDILELQKENAVLEARVAQLSLIHI